MLLKMYENEIFDKALVIEREPKLIIIEMNWKRHHNRLRENSKNHKDTVLKLFHTKLEIIKEMNF